MKKTLLLLSLLFISLIAKAQTIDLSPNPFDEDEEITITVSNFDSQASWGVSDIYLWAWYFDENGDFGANSPLTGDDFSNAPESAKFTKNGDGTFTYTFTSTTFYEATNISRIGFLVKSQDGTNQTGDNLFDVGRFQLTLNSPTENSTILNAGETLSITASATENSDFTLIANDVTVDAVSNSASYTNDYIVNENTSFKLEATNGTETQNATFEVIIKPTVTEEALPSGLLDGMNPDPNDDTKATLVLFAPDKEFVHVIGDFNNWQIDNQYLMKKDSSQDRFWIELTGLTPQFNHMYQYLVDATINVADPYSTTILDESQDEFIDAVTYPNLPLYPTGQTTQAVTLLRLGDAEFQWQTTDFVKPERTDMVIYELLIRDFDDRHSFDAVTDRLDYLENLGVNTIELMPVNEFDGNLSWGYNSSFHMALDKYYGTPTAFKEFVDACHARGIAVVIDVVFNHASGQFPFYRMYNDSNGGFGGQASANSPFFNQQATHSFSVFNDFNHSTQATRDYVKRVTQFWINEYKIDGFRWDLTKGFTQNCSSGDSCTNDFQQDRVDVLKLYADFQWEIDPDFFVIFEHLGFGGSRNEEIEWANYRLNEGKGIMFWNKLNPQYSEGSLGFNESNKSNFSEVSYLNIGLSSPSNVAYMESHDEERLMYKNFEFGNSNGDYNVKDFETGLKRSELAGAFFFTVPGPKMIWQYGELGYDFSINRCGDGSINESCRTDSKPIRLDYIDDPSRFNIYETWSDLIKLKLEEPIFKTDNFAVDAGSSSGLKKIQLTDDDAINDEIKYVTILGNFGVVPQEIIPDFQSTGTWYNILSGNQPMEVSDPTATIMLQPGEYLIFADQPSLVLIDPDDTDADGVPNGIDLCPDTPFGAIVDVDGCKVFTLPSANFALKLNSETCRSSDNGSIEIVAQLNLNYTATLSGNNINTSIPFNETATFSDLATGNYTICITVDGETDYEQCFEINISEPEDLSVFSRTDASSKTVTLSLKGSSSYTVELNGSVFKTNDATITLALTQLENTLKVSTDKDCQGVYAETIFLSDQIVVHPNPVKNGKLFITMGQLQDPNVKISLYEYSGKMLLNKSYIVQNNRIEMNMNNFGSGLYILTVQTDASVANYKIVKQ